MDLGEDNAQAVGWRTLGRELGPGLGLLLICRAAFSVTRNDI